jgi:DNA modification methylase
MIQLLLGDCRDRLKELPDNSIDSIVTDPPYELGFMGKSWDASGVAYDVTVWQECLRVLKPGGHLLSFGGSRTYHRMACAIEDAGFQIRDQIMWVYGSGFPKSLNISKAIDKKRDDTEVIHKVVRWLESKRKNAGITRSQVEQHFGTKNIGQALFTITTGSVSRIATWDQWQELKTLLHFDDSMDDEVWRLNGRKGKPGDAFMSREVIGKGTSGKTAIWSEDGGMGEFEITAPATAEAEVWDGWGTALKPAHEPIVLARKPLDGTVANNVLKHGVGGINIDGCRVGNETRTYGGMSANQPDVGTFRDDNWTPKQIEVTVAGRFPANFIHDGSDEVLELFPETKGGTWNTTKGARHFNNDGEPTGYETSKSDSSTGSAARFFYCAKASKKDRNEGLDGFEEKQTLGGGGLTAEIKEDGSYETASAGGKFGSVKAKQTNHHPTVKPTDLMRYLCRLVTPPNGTVLDPFTGSGSTGKAATLEGFNFIGIEQSPEYIEIAKARIESVTK